MRGIDRERGSTERIVNGSAFLFGRGRGHEECELGGRINLEDIVQVIQVGLKTE